MNKYILLVAVFLLSGCPGPMDRLVSREYATTVIKNNQVCVISPLRPDEQITAVEISSSKSNLLFETFADKPIYIAKGECLPLFNIIPQPGLRHSIYWTVISPKADFHLVETRFSVTVDNSGNLKLQ